MKELNLLKILFIICLVGASLSQPLISSIQKVNILFFILGLPL
jgi:hypothetical protein